MPSNKSKHRNASRKSAKRSKGPQPTKDEIQENPTPVKKLRLSTDKASVPGFDASHRTTPSTNFLEEILLPLLERNDGIILISWMLDFKLLKVPKQCSSSDCNSENIQMQDCKGSEGFQWECKQCKQKMNLRIGSFFYRLPCSLKSVIYVVLGWCKRSDAKKMSHQLGLTENVVSRIYSQCVDIAQSHVKVDQDIILGGPKSVVLVDMWPNGGIHAPNLSRIQKRKRHDRLRVLWITDTKHFPVCNWPILLPPPKTLFEIRTLMKAMNSNSEAEGQKYFVEKCTSVDVKQEVGENYYGSQNCDQATEQTISPSHKQRELRILKEHQEVHDLQQEECEPIETGKINVTKKTKKHKKSKKSSRRESVENEVVKKQMKEGEEFLFRKELLETVLSVIHNHIAPGSLVVANEDAIPNICSALRDSGRYETVTSVGNILSVDDSGYRPTHSILDNIWQPASVQSTALSMQTRLSAHRSIAEFRWFQMFGNNLALAVFNILSQIACNYVPKNP